MRYKRNDKIKVRRDLVGLENYNGIFTRGGMLKYVGKQLTIDYIMFDKYYTVKENMFIWTDAMLEN